MDRLPTTYKACCYAKPGENNIEIRDDMAMPSPGPGEVLINITHSGVCHSDLAVMTNGWSALPYPTKQGQVGGHEGVGHVVQLGPGADVHCKIGDRVGVKWIANACGNCVACLEGNESSCQNGRKISGYFFPGTFQQYVLSPAHYVTPIPANVESAAAAPMLCAGVTAYSALRKSGAQPGQRVAIFGAGGGLGHLAVEMASHGMGFHVIGVDHSSKEDLVRNSGAESFVAFDRVEDVTESVKEASDGTGVHAALVLTGSNIAYAQGLSVLRFGGQLVCVGVPEGEPQAIKGVIPSSMIFRGLRIVGVAVGNRRDAIECLDMVARGKVKVHYSLRDMSELQQVFAELEAGSLQGRVVLELL